MGRRSVVVPDAGLGPLGTMEIRKETAWARGWRDTKRAWTGWRLLVLGGVASPVFGLATGNALAAVVLFSLILGAVWFWATVTAPIKQRNEARAELAYLSAALPRLELSDPELSEKIVDQTTAQHWSIRLRNTVPNTSAHGVAVELSAQPPLASTSAPLPLPRVHSSSPLPLRHDVPYGVDVVFDVASYDEESRIFYLWRADHIEDQLGPTYMVYNDSIINKDRDILDVAVDNGGIALAVRAVSADGRSSAQRDYVLVRDAKGDCSLTAMDSKARAIA